MSENNERNFDLGTVLSITTGRVFTEFGNIYKILNYLSRDNLFTNQLPRVAEIAQPYILTRYPQLNGVGKDVIINSQADVETFLNSQKKVLGDSFALSPMPEEMCEHINPIKEAEQMILSRTKNL